MKQVRNTKQKYGFRKIKYVAGFASAMLASVNLSTAKPQTVHADTNTNNNLQDNRATGEKAAKEELDHIPDNPNSKTQTPSQKRTVHIIDDSTQQDLKQEKPVKNTPNVNKSIVHNKKVETPKTTDKDYIPDNPKDSPNKTTNHVDNTVDNNTVQTTDKDYIPDNPKDSPNKTASHVDNTVDNKTLQTADISTAALDVTKKQIAAKSAKMAKLSNNFSLDNTSLFSSNDADTTNPNTVANALNVNDAVDNTLNVNDAVDNTLNVNDAYALDPKNNLHEHANVNDNGGYDENYWGKLDVSKWQGNIADSWGGHLGEQHISYYQLTSYDGDPNNIIVPNEADFEKAGISTSGLPVGISSDLMSSLAQKATRIGLSKTNNEKVVACDNSWRNAFGGWAYNPAVKGYLNGGGICYSSPNLTQMDLHNLDTLYMGDMDLMFNGGNNLTTVGDLSKWDTRNVSDMSHMFYNASKLTDIGDLSHWNMRVNTNMGYMFGNASSLTNIGDLSHWNIVARLGSTSGMFQNASSLTNIGDLSHWPTDNITYMNPMFYNDKKLCLIINNPNGWQHINDDGWKYENGVNTHINAGEALTGVPVVITNNANILKAKDDSSYTIDGQSIIRSSIFDSSNSPIPGQAMPTYKPNMTWPEQEAYAANVVKLYNQKLMQDYHKAHPDKRLVYAPGQDMNDPRKLALASFVTTDNIAKINIVYVDSATNKTVKTTPLQGLPDEQINLTYEAPVNYTIAPNQSLPNNYRFTDSDNSDIHVLLNHATQSTTQTHTASRIFKLQFNGQDIKHDYVQTGTITRTGNRDLVTGNVQFGTYSHAEWNEITTDALIKLYQQYGYQTNSNNYTLDGNKFAIINAVEIDPNTQDETHTINVVPTQETATLNFIDDDDNDKVISHQVITGLYTETKQFLANVPNGYVLTNPTQSVISHYFTYNDQSIIDIHVKHKIQHANIVYVDKDTNKTVKTTPLQGVTDEQINLTYEAPVNYTIAPNQSLPNNYRFAASDNSNIYVLLNHATQSITQTHTASRIFKLQFNGQDIKHDYVQTGTITRTNTRDLVTGNVQFGAYSHAEWNEITTDALIKLYQQYGYQTNSNNYTLDGNKFAAINAVEIDPNTQDETHIINVVPTQETATLNFIDDDDHDKVISHQVITGLYTETKQFWTNVPNGYVLTDPTQSVISHYFTYNDQSIIDIHVKHKIQHTNIVYVDKATNKTVKTTPLQGVTDEQINLTYEAPVNYTIAPNQSLPNNYRFAASDNSNIYVWLNHATQSTTQTHTASRIFKFQFNGQDIKHDYVQTDTITRTNTRDLVTGDVQFGAYSHAEWNEITTNALIKLYQQYGYQTNSNNYTLDGNKFATINAVEIDPNTQDETHIINVVPTQETATLNFIDDDDNDKVISHQVITGLYTETKQFWTNVPDDYVLTNPNQIVISHQFTYNDQSIIDIHVKHKIIGTVADLNENAHNDRDYLINQIKSHQVKNLIDGVQDDSNKDLDQLSSNISIVQDPDQTYTANYNDEADINNKLNQINNDYNKQQNDIINQFKDWYNKAKIEAQAPKLQLHYHNDNLHLTKTSTYQVIEKVPHPTIDPNKYDNDQVILKTIIMAGKDIARDMATGETKQTKFLGKYTSGIVDKGHTDGVDQTVIWGSDVGLPGYELDPFYAETKEQYDVPNNPTNQGAVLSVSDSNNTIHFNYLVGKNYQNANGVEMSDFPDDQTWYVTMHPLAQHVNIVYVDNDTNETVKTTPLQGVTDEQINLTYEAPANYTITPDQSLPNNYLFTANNNSNIYVWLNHVTQPTTQTHTAKRIFKLQFNGQDIKHDYVQTGTITRIGDSNNGDYSHAQWNEVTKDDLTKLYQQYGYQTNGHDLTLDGNKFTTINTVEIDPDTQDETHIINVVTDQRPINYIDIATNNTIASDSVQGVTNAVIKYAPNVPDGYELLTPQDSYNIPILGDNTPFDIYIKSSMIHVDHTKPHHQGESIYDDTQPNMVYPNNVDDDDLNQTLTRTINVYNPDGVITQIVQKVVLYRDADYDLSHHTTTYTPWQANGPRSWNSYTAPDFDGYTPDLSYISAATPLPDSQDVTINIHYKETGSEVVLAYNDTDESDTEVARYNEGGEPNSTIQIDWINHMTQDMPGYEIVPGQVINGQHLDDLLKNHESLTYALSDVNKPIVINIRHIASDVTNTDPKAKSSSERTLTIIEPNGHKIVYTQHVDFIRTATLDQATGLVSYGDWHVSGGYESDTNGGYTAINANNNSTYTVDSINIPAFTNYETQSNILDNKGNMLTDPNTANILPSITVSPDSPARNYLVTYHRKMNDDYFADNSKQLVDGNKKVGNTINTNLQSVTKNSIKNVVPHFTPTVIKAYQSIPTFDTKLRKANTVNPALLGFTQSKIQVQKPHNLATLGLMTTMLSLLSK